MTAAPRLVRRNHGRGHSYTLDGVKVTGVTTTLSLGFPKPALVQWAANMAASYAIDHADDLAGLPAHERIRAVAFAHRTESRRAMARGTKIHGYGERLVAGEAVEIPDEHRDPAEAYARFLDAWGIDPIAVEATVASTTSRYAGTLDLVATVAARDGARALIDIKTGKGVYDDVALQLAAYRYADLWQPDGPESEADNPPVDMVFVAHVLPDDVRMVPVKAGEFEHRIFLYVQQIARWIDSLAWHGDEPPEFSVVGDAVHPTDREEVPA